MSMMKEIMGDVEVSQRSITNHGINCTHDARVMNNAKMGRWMGWPTRRMLKTHRSPNSSPEQLGSVDQIAIKTSSSLSTIWTASYNGTDQPAHLPDKIRGLLVFNNPNPPAFDGLLEQARQKTQIPDRDIDEKISNFSSLFFHDMKTNDEYRYHIKGRRS
jgi:hypothetical protein